MRKQKRWLLARETKLSISSCAWLLFGSRWNDVCVCVMCVYLQHIPLQWMGQAHRSECISRRKKCMSSECANIDWKWIACSTTILCYANGPCSHFGFHYVWLPVSESYIIYRFSVSVVFLRNPLQHDEKKNRWTSGTSRICRVWFHHDTAYRHNDIDINDSGVTGDCWKLHRTSLHDMLWNASSALVTWHLAKTNEALPEIKARQSIRVYNMENENVAQQISSAFAQSHIIVFVRTHTTYTTYTSYAMPIPH